jgi:hypothetical protein
MSKLYLSMVGLMACLIASAQTEVFFDDFEDQDLEGYTLYNLDGLTPDDPDLVNMADSAWTVKFISSQGWENGNSAFSVSWYVNDEGPSDDWLITPAIEIGTDAMLSWDAMAITSSGDFRDRYQVFIGPSTDLEDFAELAPVFDTGEEGEIDEPTSRSLNLSELGFENETIYIAFRNNTPGFDPDQPVGPGNGGNELAIDNISVSTVLSSDEIEIFEDITLLPNPSANDMQLRFGLENPADVTLEMADITGKIIRLERLGTLSSGQHLIDIEREGVKAGLYLIRLRTDNGFKVIRAVFN